MRKRTFSLPDDIDNIVRKRAIDEDVRFSDIVEAALREYIKKPLQKKEKEKGDKKS